MKLLYRNTGDLCSSIGLLAVRLVVGAAFIIHGWDKIQNPMDWYHIPDSTPPPGWLQAAAAVAEFGGGISLVLGLLTPLFSLLLLCTMGFAMCGFHIPSGHPFVSTKGPSFELAAVYFSVAFLMLVGGPGKLSADACLFGGCCETPPPRQ